MTRAIHPFCPHGHPRSWSEKSQRWVCKTCLRFNLQRFNQKKREQKAKAKAEAEKAEKARFKELKDARDKIRRTDK